LARRPSETAAAAAERREVEERSEERARTFMAGA